MESVVIGDVLAHIDVDLPDYVHAFRPQQNSVVTDLYGIGLKCVAGKY